MLPKIELFPRDSERWRSAWAALKSRGIDGFTVGRGIPPKEHPGQVTFDWYCPICGVQIIADKSEISRHDRLTFEVHKVWFHNPQFWSSWCRGHGEGI